MSYVLKNIVSTPLSLSSITPLNFDKPLSDVPSTHIWQSKDVENYPTKSISVPVIDLHDPKMKLLGQIKQACEEWGFFQIINHDVPIDILDDFKREAMRLFSLPMEVKLQVVRGPYEASGYGGLPVSKLSPSKMWHEGFGIKKELHEHSKKLWPPYGNPKFCLVVEMYQKVMKTLAEKVLTLMLESVELTPRDINWAELKTKEISFGPHGTHFQLNSYPTCPDPNHAMGLTQHTDSSIITILNQVNNVSGLQVLHKDKWVNVKPIPGSFVINSGDLAHFFFNGQFVSPIHRVIPSRTTHRYSAAYFYGPPFSAPIAPISKLVGPGCSPMYHTITWEDYQNAKNQIGGKVFELVRVEKDEI